MDVGCILPPPLPPLLPFIGDDSRETTLSAHGTSLPRVGGICYKAHKRGKWTTAEMGYNRGPPPIETTNATPPREKQHHCTSRP